ncbi:MAG: FtsX-like permease family protein [Syntrophorhabdus sp. PtaU1.Bin050]|nr:MAG: FtsX-like permease family protein [Syntrophorhabdus sp. PtaU1.Bin050]
MANWIEKQKNILDFTLSSLLRRKGKNLSLLMAYTLLIFVLGSVMFFTQAMKREASIILKDAPEMVVQRLLQGRYDPIPVDRLEKIRKIQGVTSATARLWGYTYCSIYHANYTLVVPPDNAPPHGKIIVGNGVSRSRGIRQGDTMPIRAYNGVKQILAVDNVISPESELVSSDLILLSEADFRSIFGLPAEYATDLAITVRNPKELTTIAKKILELFPDTRPIMRNEIARTYDAVFDWRGGLMIVLVAMALLAFIILAWEKASGLNAEERRETGILKAIGWETSDIIVLKANEGLVISFFSFSLGILCAYLHVFFFSAPLFAPVLKGWSTLYADFRLTPFIDPYQVVVLFFLTVVPYTVATIIPSWKAAIVDPDSVMRT